MRVSFSGEIFYWRGPAPHFFVSVPDEHCAELQDLSEMVSYGWGMIPVTATIGATTWKTSLFPKDGRYLVPIKALVRNKENLDEGQTTSINLAIAT